MSHRSRLRQLRKQATVPSYPNVQPRPEPQQITPDQLVPMLIRAGNQVQWRLDLRQDHDPPLLVLWLKVGPIEIPLALTADDVQGLQDQLDAGLDQMTAAQPEAQPGPAEDLLAESIIHVNGDTL